MLKKWLAVSSILLMSNYAQAFDCTAGAPGSNTISYNTDIIVNFSVRPEIGKRISDWKQLAPINVSCATPYKMILLTSGTTGDTGLRVSESGKTYPVFGIVGIKSFGLIIEQQLDGGAYVPAEWTTSSMTNKHIWSDSVSHTLNSRAALVIITNGQIDELAQSSGNNLGTALFVDASSFGQGGNFNSYDRRGGISPLRLKAKYTYPTCDIAANSLNPVATLPPVTASAFRGVGSTVGSANVILSLSCKRNMSGKGLDVFTSFTDMNSTNNTGSVLQVSGGATGVGVQMTGPNGLITYGPEKGSTNRWKIGTSINDSGFTIPIKINYVQTAATIKPGVAQARASYIITYN